MKEKLHFGLVSLINIILVGLIINFVWSSNSDKSVFIFIIFYPMLTVLNLLIWIMMTIRKYPRSHIYKWMTIALIIGFIPATILVGLY
jgi:hypothetical protein